MLCRAFTKQFRPKLGPVRPSFGATASTAAPEVVDFRQNSALQTLFWVTAKPKGFVMVVFLGLGEAARANRVGGEA